MPSRHVTAAPDSALSAMAREAGGGFGRAFAVEIFKKTPGVAGLKPGGRDVAKDIADCGVINVEADTPDVKLTGAERAQRKTKRASRATNPGSGALWKVAQQAGSAVDGAVTTLVAHARSSVMRTSRRTIFAFVLGAIPLAPAFAFDGTPVNAPARQAAPLGVVSAPAANAAPTGNKPVPPAAVPNAGAAATTVASNAASSQVVALEYAAEGGHPVAQWKLGRMYADGDGVAQNDLRAFEYFSRIANQHAEDSPSAPQAAIVANAFVALGRYYLSGIPNSKVKSDPERAREMFNYAASYFGNADAQYDLARLYFKSTGNSPESFRQGIRWLGLAAQKGQYQAQALLGQMLFNGDQMPPQRARGLMWLTLARDSAGTDEAWIKESYNRAIAKASESDRAMALQMLEHWVKGRRE